MSSRNTDGHEVSTLFVCCYYMIHSHLKREYCYAYLFNSSFCFCNSSTLLDTKANDLHGSSSLADTSLLVCSLSYDWPAVFSLSFDEPWALSCTLCVSNPFTLSSCDGPSWAPWVLGPFSYAGFSGDVFWKDDGGSSTRLPVEIWEDLNVNPL